MEVKILLRDYECKELVDHLGNSPAWGFDGAQVSIDGKLETIDLCFQVEKSTRFLVKVTDEKEHSMYIDDLVLEGDKEDLIAKMGSLEFVTALGIHESFLFEKFTLVPEDSVEFPEHRI